MRVCSPIRRSTRAVAVTMMLGLPALGTAAPGPSRTCEGGATAVRLSYQASRAVAPDVLAVRLTVRGEARDAARAAAEVNERASRIVEHAKAQGDTLLVESGDYRTEPRYGGGKPPRIEAWAVRHSLTVRSTDFGAAMAFAAWAQQHAGLDGLTFEVSPALSERTTDELVGEAIAGLNRRLRLAANALGRPAMHWRQVSLGGPTAPPFPGPRMAAMAERAGAVPDLAVAPGERRIQLSVSGVGCVE